MPSNPLNADTSVATTECPRLASTCVVAIPMPRAAPVIKILRTCVADHFDFPIQMTFLIVMRIGRANPLKDFSKTPQRLRSLAEMIAHTWRTSLIRLVLRADSISSAAIEIESRERIACCSFLALSRYR